MSSRQARSNKKIAENPQPQEAREQFEQSIEQMDLIWQEMADSNFWDHTKKEKEVVPVLNKVMLRIREEDRKRVRTFINNTAQKMKEGKPTKDMERSQTAFPNLLKCKKNNDDAQANTLEGVTEKIRESEQRITTLVNQRFDAIEDMLKKMMRSDGTQQAIPPAENNNTVSRKRAQPPHDSVPPKLRLLPPRRRISDFHQEKNSHLDSFDGDNNPEITTPRVINDRESPENTSEIGHNRDQEEDQMLPIQDHVADHQNDQNTDQDEDEMLGIQDHPADYHNHPQQTQKEPRKHHNAEEPKNTRRQSTNLNDSDDMTDFLPNTADIIESDNDPERNTESPIPPYSDEPLADIIRSRDAERLKDFIGPKHDDVQDRIMNFQVNGHNTILHQLCSTPCNELHNICEMINMICGAARDRCELSEELNEDSITAIHLAVKNGHVCQVRTLLSHKGPVGAAPLQTAYKKSNKRIMDLLLRAGADYERFYETLEPEDFQSNGFKCLEEHVFKMNDLLSRSRSSFLKFPLTRWKFVRTITPVFMMPVGETHAKFTFTFELNGKGTYLLFFFSCKIQKSDRDKWNSRCYQGDDMLIFKKGFPLLNDKLLKKGVPFNETPMVFECEFGDAIENTIEVRLTKRPTVPKALQIVLVEDGNQEEE